jgi:hypothetical protein
VHEIGSDVSRLAEQLIDARGLALGADAPHPTTGASLRVLGMLPAPLPVTLRVRPGALAGSPRSDAGDAHASSRKITARLADVVVVDNLPVPAHVSLRRATECASARGRDDVVADLVLCVCDPRAPKTKPNAFPERYRARIGWEGVKVGEHPAPTCLTNFPVATKIAPPSRLAYGSRTRRKRRLAPPPCTTRRTASRLSGTGFCERRTTRSRWRARGAAPGRESRLGGRCGGARGASTRLVFSKTKTILFRTTARRRARRGTGAGTGTCAHLRSRGGAGGGRSGPAHKGGTPGKCRGKLGATRRGARGVGAASALILGIFWGKKTRRGCMLTDCKM